MNRRSSASRIMLKHNAARIKQNAAELISLIINRRTEQSENIIGAAPSPGPIKKRAVGRPPHLFLTGCERSAERHFRFKSQIFLSFLHFQLQKIPHFCTSNCKKLLIFAPQDAIIIISSHSQALRLAPEEVPIVNPSMLQNKSFKNFN